VKTHNSAENFDTYRNLQPHRAVLPAIARHLVRQPVQSTDSCHTVLQLTICETLTCFRGEFPGGKCPTPSLSPQQFCRMQKWKAVFSMPRL